MGGSDSNDFAWRALLQRYVHIFAGAAAGVGARNLQVVVKPYEWDIKHPHHGRYLEWTLPASVAPWSNYVTLGDVRRSFFEGYREAIEFGFPIDAKEREVYLMECNDSDRWGLHSGGAVVRHSAPASPAPIPGFSFKLSARDWLRRAKTRGLKAPTFHVKQSSRPYDDLLSAFKGGAGPDGHAFLSITDERGRRPLKSFAREREIDVKLSAVACELLSCRPRAWYNDTLISCFAKHMVPRPGYEREPGAGWWGRRGAFSLMTTGIIVAYRPKARVRVSLATHAELMKGITKTKFLDVGPFRFRIGKPGEGEVSLRNHGSSGAVTYVCESRSDVLQVMGVTSRVMGAPDYVAPPPGPSGRPARRRRPTVTRLGPGATASLASRGGHR